MILPLLLWPQLSLQAKAQRAPLKKAPLKKHYLCAENIPLETYLEKRWSPQEFPIKVHLPYPSQNFQLKNRQQHREAVLEAFKSWHRAWPRLQFRIVPRAKEADIEVIFFKHIYRRGKGRWGEAYTPYPIGTKNGYTVHHSKVHLAVRAHPGSAYATSEAVEHSFEEMRDLAIHEIGHALGLPHSDDGNDVMGGGNHFLITVLNQRNISPRDVYSLKTLYRLKKDSTNFCD